MGLEALGPALAGGDVADPRAGCRIGDLPWWVTGLRNLPTQRPPVKRAAPAVGRMSLVPIVLCPNATVVLAPRNIAP
jgi:hypothetical protein